eukprot:TRINITY_DN788_c0_g2_i1.p1 TRINITY_DN788_c0_g2~~TRINITY_DN788_c0_g2_i1.p1  ORF type:complete len:316 (-),score=44.50 TRINITY_DN788_c0_g2_i1:584-1531(-)
MIRRPPRSTHCISSAASDVYKRQYQRRVHGLLEENMSKVPLTVAGAEKLREELHRLKTVDRPWVIGAIAEARSHGDLSENAEYDAAKERQGFIEGRIQEVEGKLSNAQIIDPKLLDADGRCVFGATAEIEDQDSGDSVTYQIVGEDEADIKAGKISVNSPMARALIGKYAGDIAQVQAPGGIREYEIINVRYEQFSAETGRSALSCCHCPVGGWPMGDRLSGSSGVVCQSGRPSTGRYRGGQTLRPDWLGWAGQCCLFADFPGLPLARPGIQAGGLLAGDSDGADGGGQPVRDTAADGPTKGGCLAARSHGKRLA